MGWDSAAVLMVEIATSIGLLEPSIEGKAITEIDTKSVEEEISKRVCQKYWMKEESKSLGDFLYHERNEKFANKIEDNICQIKERIMAVLKDMKIDESKKKKELGLCKENLILLLKHMKILNGGKLPNHDLELYLNKLSG